MGLMPVSSTETAPNGAKATNTAAAEHLYEDTSTSEALYYSITSSLMHDNKTLAFPDQLFLHSTSANSPADSLLSARYCPI